MYSFPPLAAAIGVLYTIVTGLTAAFTPLLGPASPAIAIVALTGLIRVLLVPLGYAQARGEHARTRLQPKVQELQRKYRTNPERLQREMLALYRREGTSPLAGCLPALAQAPVFMVLYGLFLTGTIGGQPNELLSGTLAGIPLGARLADVGISSGLAVFAVLLALLVLVALATRRTMPVAGAAAGTPATKIVRWLPFGTVLVAAGVPLAAGVYLLTTTAWTAAERPILRRLTAPAPSPG
jgi:YidC/Oxa1 family membrane protein insertase